VADVGDAGIAASDDDGGSARGDLLELEVGPADVDVRRVGNLRLGTTVAVDDASKQVKLGDIQNRESGKGTNLMLIT
jgi:hypothetical protein